MTRPILRGDIYRADLSPIVGSEQGGVRPVLVIQNDIGNMHSPTVIVAAITRRNKPCLPTHIRLAGLQTLERNSVTLLEQIRTIDKSRLTEYIGSIGEETMKAVDAALAVSVGLRNMMFPKNK
jgi:mRNA interferase MazF